MKPEPVLPTNATVTVTPTFWELFDAALSAIRFQGALILVHAIFPVAGLTALLLPLLAAGRPPGFDEIWVAVLGLMFTPLVTAFAIWSKRRRNKLAQGPFTYGFDSVGVHITGASFDMTMKWSAILRVRQSRRFLFIFISPRQAHSIALKTLKAQGVLESVRAIAQSNADFR